jgi:PAS domain S-box-containing protein
VVGERGGDLDRDKDEETIAITAESLLTFENAAVPLSVVCPAGRIIMANRAMRSLLGYEFSDLVGRSIYEIVLAEEDELAARWERRLQSAERVTPERRMRLRCGDGTEITVRASSVLVTDRLGAVRYIVARAVLEGP